MLSSARFFGESCSARPDYLVNRAQHDSPSNLAESRCPPEWEWLFFQNPIVLYLFELHVSIEPAAASSKGATSKLVTSTIRNTKLSEGTHGTCTMCSLRNFVFRKGTCSVEPLQGSCSRLNADVQLQLHFLVQYNGFLPP